MRKLLALLLSLSAFACTSPRKAGSAPLTQSTDPRSTTYTNTGTMTPPPNGSWSTAQWYVSYATGNDNNLCLASSSPCATIAEIQRRWGGTPVLPQATTITVLDTPTTAQMLADPWNVRALVTKGGNLTLAGPVDNTVLFCSGTLNTVTAKSRGTAVPLKSTFTLTSQADGGACSIAAGQLAAVTTPNDGGPTHLGRSWIFRNPTGSTWQLTQPMATVANPFALSWPAEVDTWASGDLVNLYVPVGINLVAFDVRPTDPSVNGGGFNSFSTYGQVLDLTLLDPQTSDAGYAMDPVEIGPYVHLLETWSQRPVVTMVNPGNAVQGFVNTVLAGGISDASDHANLSGPVSNVFPATVQWGGAIGGPAAAINEISGNVLDGDVTISGTVNCSNCSFGWTFLDSSSTLNVTGLGDLANHAVNGSSTTTAYDVWGPGTLDVAGSGRLVIKAGASVANKTLGDGGPTVQLNGQTLMCLSTVDAGHTKCGITVSAANIDTNLGTNTVAASVTNPNGASITNGSP